MASRWGGVEGLWRFRRNRLQAGNAAVLGMGFCGVTALGCTIGQGISGLSTLALGSLLAVGGIVAGCVGAMQWLKRRL